jgi:hypothetical protein
MLVWKKKMEEQGQQGNLIREINEIVKNTTKEVIGQDWLAYACPSFRQ